MYALPELQIGDMVAEIPVIQGGMGVGVSGVSLVSAVANEGGIGVLSSAGMGFDEAGYLKDPVFIATEVLRQEIKNVRKLTKGLVGVNIMVATSNYANMVKAAIDERIDFIFAGAGLPLDLPSHLSEEAKTKLVPIVSSARAATLIARTWISRYDYLPDAIVVEGPLAGGHLGFKKEQINDAEFKLQKLVREVITAVIPFEVKFGRNIPVIAAGGIYSGSDINEFLDLGAAGVQMGTRFVTTTECDVSDEFKNCYIQCNEEDIILIDSPVGMPGRAIRNVFLDSMNEGKLNPVNCPYHCILSCDVTESPYCIARALLNAKKGKMNCGFAFAGQNAYRSDKILSVHELFESLKSEYRA